MQIIRSRAIIALCLSGLLIGASAGFGQQKKTEKITGSNSSSAKEHEANVLGVAIGMDVSTALQTVFTNANRQPGQEKPDAKKYEGKDKKDVRVIYKNLAAGDLQIVFADGKFVKEIVLDYRQPPLIDDLRLPYTSSLGNSTSLITTQSGDQRGLSTRSETLGGTVEIDGYNATNSGNVDRRRGEALDGTRYDDRYTVAFTDNQKQQRIWWREERATPATYRVRVQFTAEKITKAGAREVVRIIRKIVFLKPEDEAKFKSSLAN